MRAAILLLAISASPSHDYAGCYRQHVDDKRPLLVLVGAAWCPHCPHAKRMLRDARLPPETIACELDLDEHRQQAQQVLQTVRSIPTFVLYKDGRRLVYQPGDRGRAADLERFARR